MLCGSVSTTKGECRKGLLDVAYAIADSVDRDTVYGCHCNVSHGFCRAARAAGWDIEDIVRREDCVGLLAGHHLADIDGDFHARMIAG